MNISKILANAKRGPLDALLVIPPIHKKSKKHAKASGNKRPIPPSKKATEPIIIADETPFQRDMMAIVKKHGQLNFLSHYHQKASIALPSSLNHKIKRTTREATHSIVTASHSMLGVDIPALTTKFVCNRKIENAGTFIQAKLCISLLKNVDADFVNNFALSSRYLKIILA